MASGETACVICKCWFSCGVLELITEPLLFIHARAVGWAVAAAVALLGSTWRQHFPSAFSENYLPSHRRSNLFDWRRRILNKLAVCETTEPAAAAAGKIETGQFA